MSRVLGLFAKRPDAGRVKTRLASGTSPEWAARVAAAFLRDAVHRLGHLADRRVLAFAPDDARPYFSDVVGDRFILVTQQGDDLGGRMSVFFAEQINAGANSIVLLGTDSPTLPITLVEQAFAELERADVVLGPATDGGYYLLGCRCMLPVFHDVAWSSSCVLEDTVRRLNLAPGLRLALLPPWYDVDTPDDWQVLRGHVAAMLRAGHDPNLPHTLPLIQNTDY
jgi:rSAM/selenodomain-associated transferase 1